MSILFLLSHGRTGTVFLDNLISNLPKISSSHERHGNILRAIYHARYKEIDNKLLNKIALNLITNPINKYKKTKFPHIEINNQIKYYIKDVYEKFPNSVYIHITRDPRTHVVSGVNWTLDKKINKLFKLYFPFWSPRPQKYSLGNDDLSKLFEITNINWMESNSAYIELEKISDKYYHFKFEDFLKDKIGFVQKILHLAGYEYWNDKTLIQRAISKSPQNESTFKTFPHWHDWGDKYILYIHERCSGLMKKFGYGDEPEWHEKIKLALERKNKKNVQKVIK